MVFMISRKKMFVLLNLSAGFKIRPGFALIIIFMTITSSVIAQYYVSPEVSAYLPSEIEETSGLMNLDGVIWTHTDSGGEAEIYEINPSTGEIVRTVEIVNADNDDWEDIAWDDDFVFIGDFGNNDGSRTDLKIYRVLIADLDISDEVYAETIDFYYSDQSSFEPNYHNTNFDCEALVSFDNQLYLFTKNWLDNETNCYVLPNTPGEHEATHLSNFNTSCLVTGATVLPDQDVLVLIGYNQSGGSMTWLFEGFTGDDFFNGGSSQLIWTVLSQIEGVCNADEQSIYISSEKFSLLEPTLYWLELTDYLTRTESVKKEDALLYGQKQFVFLKAASNQVLSGDLFVYDLSGKMIDQVHVQNCNSFKLSLNQHQGLFLVTWKTESGLLSKKILLN